MKAKYTEIQEEIIAEIKARYQALQILKLQQSVLSQERIMTMLQKKSFPMQKGCILVRALMFCLL